MSYFQDVTSDDIETINNSKLLRNKKTVTNGSDQDLELSLGTGDDISASTVIEGVDTKVFQDNLSCDTKTITCTDSEDAPSDETSEPIATQPLDRNQVTEQILKRDLSRPISSVASVELHDKSILNNAIEGSTQRLAYWIDEAIRVGLKEIVCLYHYSFEFEEKVKNITADGKTKDKTARSMIYKDMLQYLPNVTLGNLRIRTHRAKNILMLFGEKGVGIDRIKLVTCSASDISRLTNTQIQNIIDYVNDKTVTNNDQSHVTSKTVTIGNDRSHDLSPATPRASVSPVSIPRTNPTYDRSYFHNKILDQYSNLYREYSSEDFDYYDITDKTLCDPSRTCPLCKLDHDDEESIEGNMSKSDKKLTSEYLNWHAKLTGLPSVLTDRIRSKLYKTYKKETGNEPWQLPKAVIDMSAESQASDFKPITFEARPDPELIIKSVLEHFPYLKFRNSFRGIDNYNFASPQPWSSPCPICDGKHGNYGLHGEWYKNETEYRLTCFTSSNKFKFAIVT
ncbi:hypothetical protein RclHR1_20910006 [Rhizophagus clarus]|uniref:Uncharacterized protein n=1 Tax=Rhizophagus clarus TaxID=94130 RepID=A0A2Z6R7I2_9GLOM|nr:hypothetical protein RclHR1_20910006 [Rhizophagus clarus]